MGEPRRGTQRSAYDSGAHLGLMLAGAVLVGAFFLSWSAGASGFDLARETELGFKGWLFWIIPLGGLLSLVTAMPGWRIAIRIGAFTGVATLCLTAYLWGFIYVVICNWGFWVMLASGVAALLLPLFRAAYPVIGVPGAILAIGFFFPWVGDKTGFDTVRHAPLPGWLETVLWVTPLLGLITAVASFSRRASAPILSALSGGLVIVAVAAFPARLFREGAKFGMWLTVIAAVLALLAAATQARKTWQK